MEIVEIWQNLEKNAAQIMIFLPHYIWAEKNNIYVLCSRLLYVGKHGIHVLSAI